MPNRTFFIDNESIHPGRTRPSPVRSQSDSVVTLSNERLQTQNQERLERDRSHRRLARRIASSEKECVRRQRAHRTRGHGTNRRIDFEHTFPRPHGTDIAADTSKAAADLQSCTKPDLYLGSADLTPMERFVLVNPPAHPWCIDLRTKLLNNDMREGDQMSVRERIQCAIKLAADVTLTRRRAALEGLAVTEDQRDDKGTSWLDLDEDSLVSCIGGSGTAPGEAKGKIRRPGSSQTS